MKQHAQQIVEASSCEGHEFRGEFMACPACLRTQGLIFIHLGSCAECRAAVLAFGLRERDRFIQGQLDDLGPEPPQ